MEKPIRMNNDVTSLKTGNVKELWKISFPMMISFMSMAIMLFIDRIFLAYYSTSALNAAVQAGTLAWGFILGWMVLTTMSEVFVSQYNGAKEYTKIGRPVWQMIWLCIFSLIFFIPMAIWGGNLFYHTDPSTLQEREYFRYFMYAGPIYALIPAIGGFFIGQGKTRIMQWLAVLGNIVNITLDPLFIFGVPGIIPEMGVIGAAIATNMGTLIQVIILMFLLLNKENQRQFATNDYKIYPSLFLKTLKVGMPPALFAMLELLGWALFYHMMVIIGPVHILVSSICQSILLLFIFFGMGLEKGAIALTGNFIGSGNSDKVYNIFGSAIKLSTWYFLINLVFLVLLPDPLINWFFNNPEALAKGLDLETLTISIEEIKTLVRTGLIFICFYIFFENLRWTINGMLTAAGDTLFLLISGTLAVWGLMIIPTYFFIVLPKAHIYYAFGIWVLYSGLACLIAFLRLILGAWKKKDLIDLKKTAESTFQTILK